MEQLIARVTTSSMVQEKNLQEVDPTVKVKTETGKLLSL